MTKILIDEAVANQPQAVPLHEQLALVPANARLVVESEDGTGTLFIPVGRLCQEAAAAIRQALADAALDKMAENASELGLSYGQPAQQEIDWKDQYEKQKRRADMWVAKYEADIGPLEKAGPVAEQPAQQEPVAWMYQCSAGYSPTVLLLEKQDWAESGSGLWTESPLYTSPQAQPAQPLTDDKYEAIVDDLSDWRRYVEVDTAHQTLEEHVRQVLTAHGITKGNT